MLWKTMTAGLIAFLMGLTPAAADPVQDKLASDLKRSGLPIQSVKKTQAQGVYQVISKDQVFFIFVSGKEGEDGGSRYYLTEGLRDLRSGKDLGEATRKQIRIDLLAKLGEQRMLVFDDENAKHTVTVFTDTTCGYCQILHRQMDDYLAQGIRIRYLLYPRSGAGSDSYKTLVSIWCSPDPKSAMHRTMARLPIPENLCDDQPVDQHLKIGHRFGLNGTPAIVTESGDMIPGYVPPKKLRAELDRLAAAK